MPEIEFIRPGHTFIIAEGGVNHNGDVGRAHSLIDAAADAGVDAIKFQTWRAEGLATAEAPKAAYQLETTGSGGNQLDMLRELELPEEAIPELIAHAQDRGIRFLSTPHDWEAIDILDRFDVFAYKVGSPDLTNIPWLAHMATKGRPIILSTGMSTLSEVDEAVQRIRAEGNEKIVLLHCITSYPAKFQDCNLRAMQTLHQAFQVPVGYSDHTPGVEVSVAAVAMGASVIEKHFTLDRNLPGPDHLASLEPDQLRALVDGIRNVETALGSAIKQPVPIEQDIKPMVRKSVVATRNIPAGSTITADLITTKRPGTGIAPKYLESLLGRHVSEDIPEDAILQWAQIR